MSNTLSPHSILSKLEENKCNKLQAQLLRLTAKHEQLVIELNAAEVRLQEIESRRRNLLKHNVMASDLTTLETARREDLARKGELSEQLSGLSDEEKRLKAEVFACLNKFNAYGLLQDKEKKLQKRLFSRAEQQAVDDLMASRCVKGY